MSPAQQVVSFTVQGIPPGYDGGSSISNPKHNRHGQFLALREAATAAMAGRQPFSREQELEMTIAWSRRTARGKRAVCDGANAISGVANSIQGIVYIDDEQVTAFEYRESQAEIDSYIIEVRPLP